MAGKKGEYLFPLLGISAFLLVWQLAASYLVRRSWLLPYPLDVVRSLGENIGLLLHHSGYTAAEALIGLAIAVVISLIAALLMSLSRLLKKMVYPLLLGSQMVPIVILAPLFLIWFGYGILPKVLVVVLICFFPMTISILTGLNSLDGETLAFYRVMGMNRCQLFRIVRLPAALPFFFSGLRMAATYSVMGAVIGEWLGASAGLGLLLTRAQRSFDLPLAFAAIVIIIVLSALLCAAVFLAEYLVLHPQRRCKGEWPE